MTCSSSESNSALGCASSIDCWKDGKPYDEAIYIRSLRRRGSLLAGILGTSTGVEWMSVAGVQKSPENNA
jgi:hypothetical protein